MNILNLITVYCDAPKPWGLYFQDSATPQMEALLELHDNIMFYLVIILFGVAWIMVSIIRNYINNKSPLSNYIKNKSPISNQYPNRSTFIKWILIITPALILILIAFPSFKLLFFVDGFIDSPPMLYVSDDGLVWIDEDPYFTGDDYMLPEFDFYLLTENTSVVENSTSSGNAGTSGQGNSTSSGNAGGTSGSGGNNDDDDIDESQFIPQEPCSHKWCELSYDDSFIGQPCDTCSGIASTASTDTVHFCEICQAVSCNGCRS